MDATSLGYDCIAKAQSKSCDEPTAKFVCIRSTALQDDM